MAIREGCRPGSRMPVSPGYGFQNPRPFAGRKAGELCLATQLRTPLHCNPDQYLRKACCLTHPVCSVECGAHRMLQLRRLLRRQRLPLAMRRPFTVREERVTFIMLSAHPPNLDTETTLLCGLVVNGDLVGDAQPPLTINHTTRGMVGGSIQGFSPLVELNKTGEKSRMVFPEIRLGCFTPAPGLGFCCFCTGSLLLP